MSSLLLQILMNAHEELQNVIKFVLILMGITIVHVMMDMNHILIFQLRVLVCISAIVFRDRINMSVVICDWICGKVPYPHI